MKAFTLGVGLVLVVLVPAVSTQSLAEIARQEAARRKVVAPGPVYTDADLPAPDPAPVTAMVPLVGLEAAPPSLESEESASTTPAAPAASEPAVVPPPPDKRDEAFWRSNASAIRTRMEQLQADIGAILTRTAALRAALTEGGQQAAIAGDLRVATDDLERYQQDFRHLEREWMLFEKLARAAGVPADWLR